MRMNSFEVLANGEGRLSKKGRLGAQSRAPPRAAPPRAHAQLRWSPSSDGMWSRPIATGDQPGQPSRAGAPGAGRRRVRVTVTRATSGHSRRHNDGVGPSHAGSLPGAFEARGGGTSPIARVPNHRAGAVRQAVLDSRPKVTDPSSLSLRTSLLHNHILIHTLYEAPAVYTCLGGRVGLLIQSQRLYSSRNLLRRARQWSRTMLVSFPQHTGDSSAHQGTLAYRNFEKTRDALSVDLRCSEIKANYAEQVGIEPRPTTCVRTP